MDEEYRKALSARLSETATLERTAASLVAYLPELGKCEGKALTGGFGAVVRMQGIDPRRPW